MTEKRFLCDCLICFREGDTYKGRNDLVFPVGQTVLNVLVKNRYRMRGVSDQTRLASRVLGIFRAAGERKECIAVRTFQDGTFEILTGGADEGVEREPGTVVCATAEQFRLLASVRTDKDRREVFTDGRDFWYWSGESPYTLEVAKGLGYRRPTLDEFRKLAEDGETVESVLAKCEANPRRKDNTLVQEVDHAVQVLFRVPGEWAEVSGAADDTHRLVGMIGARMLREHGMNIDYEVDHDGKGGRIRIRPSDIDFLD